MFAILAEYVHQFVGRRAAISLGGKTKIPFTINSARLHPETGLIVIDAATPIPNLLTIAVGACDELWIEHEKVPAC